MMIKFYDYTGMDIGILHVDRAFKDDDGVWMSECTCRNCGEVKVIPSRRLRDSKTTCLCMKHKSYMSNCGRRESKDPLYKFWYCLINRMKVCDEWSDDFPEFKRWADSEGFRKGMRLEPEEPSKPLGPDNFLILDVPRGTILTYKGETHTLREWSEKTGLGMAALRYRVNAGWSPEKIIETPPQHRGHRYCFSHSGPLSPMVTGRLPCAATTSVAAPLRM